ncbi:MAG: sigma-70 family RNA polymerase sigma factor [Planctomycetes bacterium]|nr:sigma-70 family RNA polymerase sigma factor [Planctomycetota bacterium]
MNTPTTDPTDSPAPLDLGEHLTRHLPAMLRVARRVVRDEHLAEDVTQHAVLNALRHAHALRDRNSVRGWLLSTTRRAALDAVRASRRGIAPLQECELEGEGMDALPAVDVDHDVHEALAEIDSALNDLDADQRALLRAAAERPQREVAAELGVSHAALRARLHRLRERLRAALTHAGCAVPTKLAGGGRRRTAA